jgi:hypothetical protein
MKTTVTLTMRVDIECKTEKDVKDAIRDLKQDPPFVENGSYYIGGYFRYRTRKTVKVTR